ncbi:MAG: serine hydrolase [Bauldia sp.]
MVRFATRACAAIALAAAAFTAASAQPLTPAAAIERLFTEPLDPAWFTPAFLAQVPPDQILGLLEDMQAQFGAFTEVEGESGDLVVRLEEVEMDAEVVLDGEGRFAGLLFGVPVPIGGTVEDFVADVAALPGATSVIVLTNGELAAGHEPERVLAVGSAFKLVLLAALDDAVAAGRIAFDDIILLDPALRSIGGGTLEDWPDNTPLTVATVANLMISVSDNTATDLLLHLLGRDAAEAISERNTPFLATAELFKLKAAGNEALRTAWLDGDEAARHRVLDELAAQPLPDIEAYPIEPMVEPEWYFNGFEICALLDRTAHMEAFDINPGIAREEDWARIAFKGGSEPGVLNLSTLVTAADGTTHCVAVTWNSDEVVDEEALIVPYAGILRALANP